MRLLLQFASILSFLQELPDPRWTTSMLKVYVAAIAAYHAPIAGQSVSRNKLVVKFLKGARRLNLPCPHMISTWDLSTILRSYSWLDCALASVKQVGDL